jgi:class 3 adenylate cyclase
MSEQDTVCPHCGAAWPPDLEMRFCGECGSKLGALSPEITRKERRTLTVLFADLTGFTSFAEDRGPEETERVVDALLSDLGDVVESYDGYVDKFLGDAVMAVFGAPEAHEDDPLRAVRTGLEMLDVVERFNDDRGESLSLSVGVNTGEVLWSQVGGGDFTVTGDAVNVAKRLEDAADEGDTAVVSAAVRERAGNRVRYTRHDAVPADGRETPVRAFAVERVARDVTALSTEAGDPGGSLPLCGREAELSRLFDAFEAPEPSFLAVTGPAGIGKSRLAEAFRGRLTDRPETVVLPAGHCSQHVDAPLEPLGDVLLARAGVGRGDSGAGEAVFARTQTTLEAADLDPARRCHLAHLLAASAGLSVSDERLPELSADRVADETRRAWETWLRALATEGPVAVTVEDLQWADDRTRDLLSSLQAATADPDAFPAPVTVVTTLRPEGTVPDGVETLRLDPLSDRDTREIARATLDGPVDESLASFLEGEAGGNPYFVVELLKYLRANAAEPTTATHSSGRRRSTSPGRWRDCSWGGSTRCRRDRPRRSRVRAWSASGSGPAISPRRSTVTSTRRWGRSSRTNSSIPARTRRSRTTRSSSSTTPCCATPPTGCYPSRRGETFTGAWRRNWSRLSPRRTPSSPGRSPTTTNGPNSTNGPSRGTVGPATTRRTSTPTTTRSSTTNGR